MNDKKKKRYVVPQTELIDFVVDDIITESLTRGDVIGWGDSDDTTETI